MCIAVVWGEGSVSIPYQVLGIYLVSEAEEVKHLLENVQGNLVVPGL